MNLPILGRVDLKSVVIGALLVYFVVPFVLSLINRPGAVKQQSM